MSINTIAKPVIAYKREGKLLILARRGLVTEFQENTLSAVKRAMENEECDGCEFDLFLTKDDKVVPFQDENLKRVTGIDKSIYDT